VARALENNAVTIAERDQVRARSEVAQAELTLAENALADTELRAPFAGRIARRLVENFQNVQAGDGVLILEDITRLEVGIQLPEQDVVLLPPDAPMHGAVVGTVSFPSLPGQTFPVTVKELNTRADPRTNTYRVVLSLPRPEDGNILPGMSASFQPALDVVSSQPVYRLPVEAIQATPEGQPFVWVLAPDGRAVERRSIRKGPISGATIAIPEGLQAGDRVVTRGSAYLADGTQVRVMPAQDRN
jgi:RND family efflux transporter MFP subunit